MKAENIKRGCFYRFRNSETRYLVLHIWEKSQEAEVVKIQSGKMSDDYTRRWSLEQLGKWFTGESIPQWNEVETTAAEICDQRGYHVFPNSESGSFCEDCGITVGNACLRSVEKAAAQLEAEQAAAKPAPEIPPERKPEAKTSAEDWLNSFKD